MWLLIVCATNDHHVLQPSIISLFARFVLRTPYIEACFETVYFVEFVDFIMVALRTSYVDAHFETVAVDFVVVVVVVVVECCSRGTIGCRSVWP